MLKFNLNDASMGKMGGFGLSLLEWIIGSDIFFISKMSADLLAKAHKYHSQLDKELSKNQVKKLRILITNF